MQARGIIGILSQLRHILGSAMGTKDALRNFLLGKTNTVSEVAVVSSIACDKKEKNVVRAPLVLLIFLERRMMFCL
jgi:hypothetical protein